MKLKLSMQSQSFCGRVQKDGNPTTLKSHYYLQVPSKISFNAYHIDMSHPPDVSHLVAHRTLEGFNDPWLYHYLGFWTVT